MKNILFISIIILIIASCSNNSAISPNYSPGWQPPLVKGIDLMDGSGLRIGIWGTPDFSSEVTNPSPRGSGSETHLRIYTPYPNPSYGYFRIEYEVYRPLKVKVWITRARWVNEPINDYSPGIGGSVIIVNGNRAVEVLLDGSQELSPGRYSTTFKSLSENGEEKISQGFYRVYVWAKGVTLWRDIYINHSCQDAPPGLDRYLYNCPSV